MRIFAGIVLGLAAGTANAAEDCVNISDDESRLACYDAEYQPSQSTSTESSWSVSKEKSPIDDSVSVYLRTYSKEPIRGRLGRERDALLLIRCVENTTSMILQFGGHHMASLQQYGRVTLRIDDQDARRVRMNESTDNQALGLWNGGSSIPVVKRMFGHDTLTVRATPYSESPITTQFPITGLEEAIKPLREACHW
ncbi:type VI secretion system-associated protein TagO [Halomonas sabkhae]|nr:type VI secretion system-associated protein TagO [Halomonas sabkhae]